MRATFTPSTFLLIATFYSNASFPLNNLSGAFSTSISGTRRASGSFSRVGVLGMSSSIETNDVAKAKSLISRAISVGAPAYNAGDIAGCARVYEETAEKIVPLLPKELRTNLEQAQACASGDSNEAKAWALRRQFDAIFEYQPPVIPSPATNICNIKLEAFTPQQLLVPPLEVMDGVMGGISQGRWTESTKTFSGHTSLANNGGFASLRWRFPVAQNWSYAKGLYLKVQHSQPTSHTFRLILKDSTCERIRLANFKAIFANPQSVDQPILFPFELFDTMEQMGNPMMGAPGLSPFSVTEIGIMAIKPTVVGDFEITIEDWGLYS